MVKNIFQFYQNPYACFNTGNKESLREKVMVIKRSYLISLGARVVQPLFIP
jgi:hypothetical protein